MVRAICATSSVCVSRVRKWSPSAARNTCVLCDRRRKLFECKILSRSRWYSVRRKWGCADCARPSVSSENAASGDRSTCSRCCWSSRWTMFMIAPLHLRFSACAQYSARLGKAPGRWGNWAADDRRARTTARAAAPRQRRGKTLGKPRACLQSAERRQRANGRSEQPRSRRFRRLPRQKQIPFAFRMRRLRYANSKRAAKIMERFATYAGQKATGGAK